MTGCAYCGTPLRVGDGSHVCKNCLACITDGVAAGCGAEVRRAMLESHTRGGRGADVRAAAMLTITYWRQRQIAGLI